VAACTVFIEYDGSLTFLDCPDTKWIALGPSTTRRASHVEPVNAALRVVFHVLRGLFGDKSSVAGFTRGWKVLWRANMEPTGGPILPGRYDVRQDAIDAEINYFNQNGVQ